MMNLRIFMIIIFNMLMMMANSQMNIGVIIDDNTRAGKEIATAIKVGFDENNTFLHFRNPSDPLQAANSAEKLVKEKNVKAILGLMSWEKTALVATVGSKEKIPVISFSGSESDRTVAHQWPFLLQMVPDIRNQIICIKDIVTSFQWRKVVVIYEVDSHGSDSGVYALLSDSLRASLVDIEHRSVLPPYSSLSDPQTFLQNELADLLTKKSRVFIVLKTSVTWGIHLFREAKKLNLVDKNCAWIVSDPLAGLLDSVNVSAIYSMEGVLAVTTFFSDTQPSFQLFEQQFQRVIRKDYPEEDSSEPSLYALRAFDTITALKFAAKKSNNSTSLLTALLSSNFTGLSGLICFQDGELIHPSVLKIANVIGRKYKDLGFWSPNHGFSRRVGGMLWEKRMNNWIDTINWPGELNQVPMGWSMPSEAKPLIIGVPGSTTFEKFVKVSLSSNSNRSYTGFCIDVFREVVEIVEQQYKIPYEFRTFFGTYDDLVESVANKTFDAAVGDFTILANRSLKVEFTQPYAESGLAMLVTVKSQTQNQAWIFVLPFTASMWAVTGFMMLYTVIIVWLLEKENPEFSGPWWTQLNTAFWFTGSSLFSAHREKLQNNYTRIVVLVWLFVALALTSCYTASLSSLLTVKSLKPTVSDIQLLKDTNAKVGCDGDSFVVKYLSNVLEFKSENIVKVRSEYNYPKAFEAGNISAAFLETPYQKAYLNHYCRGYTVVGNISHFAGDRFGGLGFVFQKGSPIVEDISRAILSLSETGKLKQLEVKYFSPSPGCSGVKGESEKGDHRLNLHGFWGLYLLSAGTSALCYLMYCAQCFGQSWLRRTQQVFAFDVSSVAMMVQNYLHRLP